MTTMTTRTKPAAVAAEATAAAATTASCPQTNTSSATSSCNILMVDDEPSNLLALEAILEPLGQSLVRARSGIEALKHALKMEFCVVLLDVQMPGMNGFETAELLHKRPRTRGVPIIFLTAISKERESISRAYDVGAVDYLFKPYDPDALRTKVAAFVELGKKNAAIRAEHEALRISSARELANFKRWSDRRYEDLDDSRMRAHRALRMLADASQRLTCSLEEPHELEAVLRSALPVLGDGAILDVRAMADGDHAERLCVTRRGIDHVVLTDPRFDLGPATVAYSGRPEIFLDVVAEENDVASRPSSRPSLTSAAGDAEGGGGGGAGSAGNGNGNGDGDGDGDGDERRGLEPNASSSSQPKPSNRGGEHLRFLAELGVSAYICVPLLTHNRTIGTLTFMRLARGEYFEQADAELAGDLARRIAVSIDNARLHATSEKRREQLELANQSKDVFLAMLSHELRTPLNAIVGWTAMMKNGSLSGGERDRAVETIDRNAHALSGLVGDLLDVSRIVTGTLKLESKRVSVVSIAEMAVLAARPQCSSKQIALELSVEGNKKCPFDVLGDPGRLHQIIANLLSNSIKFTPKDGMVSVRVSREHHDEDAKTAKTAKAAPAAPTTHHAEEEGDGAEAVKRREVVRVVVSDTGEGIAPEFLPHVFERFRQEETGRAKGLGLGLAVVKHLVEEHGGLVTASSEGHGKGATFMVELPAAPADLGVDAEMDMDMSREKVNGVASPLSPTTESNGSRNSNGTSGVSSGVVITNNGAPDLTGIHVLVVEDDPDGNELVCTILQRYGARVTSTSTAADALHALESHPQGERPDILVSDIGLPDRNGMDLIKSVRAWAGSGTGTGTGTGGSEPSHEKERSAHASSSAVSSRFSDMAAIPAVALTAYASRQDATKAIAAGFDAHVAKPVQPETLAQVIARLLTRVDPPRSAS